MRKMGTIDARFTNIADNVTEAVGKWWFTVISLIILLAWIVYGILTIPGWFTSPVWNFPANSITTLGEWFMAGLTLAAANRVERRNQDVQRQHSDLLRRLDALSAQDKQTTERDLQTDTRAERRLLAVQAQLDRIEEKLDVKQSRAKGKGA